MSVLYVDGRERSKMPESCTTHREALAAARAFHASFGALPDNVSQIFLDGPAGIEVTLIFKREGLPTARYAVAPECQVKFA
jgi:hypothetical protein